jgi:hypothetical protein
MNLNIKPNFKAIRYFERLTNVSFLELENKPELVLQYLYCCLIAHPENNFNLTFDEAVKSFFPKYAAQLIEQFAREMTFINQFKDTQEEVIDEADSSINLQKKSSPKEKETVFLSSLIPILVYDCGLDINYVLNEMDYTDSELYIKSDIEHKREQMENQRFWTYLTILPHVGGKKLKEPKDLIEFPWEKEQKKHDAEKKFKEDRQKLIELGFIKEDKTLTEEKTD